MLESYFVDQATRLETSFNEWGDVVNDGTGTSYMCRFREIDSIEDNTGNKDVYATDALVHFPASAILYVGDVFVIHDKNYRVRQITDARRLGETAIQFRKANLERIWGVS